ncbi:hypothetical protein L3i22_089450 [Actinoplanes sp. L3-i22]|nr:hypothetical protein L3i22_089450 [Actinoplanes sp. L3-i22]
MIGRTTPITPATISTPAMTVTLVPLSLSSMRPPCPTGAKKSQAAGAAADRHGQHGAVFMQPEGNGA